MSRFVPPGLLVVGFNYATVAEDEFNAWYDTEHIPERQRVEGFAECERWLGADDPKISVATYELDALEVLQSPAFRAIGGTNVSPWSKRIIAKCQRICRFEAAQSAPGNREIPVKSSAMLMCATNVLAEAEAEFNEWFNAEHLTRLSAVPGCVSARHFICGVGKQRYLGIYRLISPDVLESNAWQQAANTPMTEKMRPLLRDPLRIALKRYERKID